MKHLSESGVCFLNLKVFLVLMFTFLFLNRTEAQQNVKIEKWWTEEDLNAIQTDNAGLVLNRFNFTRNSPRQSPMFIGTGEMGGFIDGLGSNTNYYASQMSHGTGLKLGFQTYDMFNAAYPWNTPREAWEKKNKNHPIVN